MTTAMSFRDYLVNSPFRLDSYRRAGGLVLSAFDIYLTWASEMHYEAAHLDLLFLKEEFGGAFGPWVEFAVYYDIYSRRVSNDSHAYYYERGEASGDGGDLDLAHDPAIPQHRRMGALFEQLALVSLPHGRRMLEIMSRFQPRVVQDPARHGKWTFQATPELEALDRGFLEICRQFERALDDRLDRELGLGQNLVANDPPIAEPTDFYDLWNESITLSVKGEADAAARNLEAILRSRPRYLPAMMRLANHHLDAGRLERAADHMKRVIDLHPEPSLMEEYVPVLRALGRTAEAAAVAAHAQRRTGTPLTG
jgi:tetratricopeptide (TPR) repeat protein